jgi:5'-3' exonuclease
LLALIDADIVKWRCAASAEQEPPEVALLRVETMMMEILNGTDTYLSYLTGPNNFRYKINPEYKANRKDKPKPRHLEICQNYLIQEYNAIVTDGYEADDALGMAQTEDSVIYSIDKDLLMIPGHHYNFVTKQYQEVSELDGLRSFYRSMLIGDTTDNIFGVEKIGKVKAAKLIDHLETEEKMYDSVHNLYVASCFDIDQQARFEVNANCLWIWRKYGETFSKRMDRRKETQLHYERLEGGVETVAAEIRSFKECLHPNQDQS